MEIVFIFYLFFKCELRILLCNGKMYQLTLITMRAVILTVCISVKKI